MALPLLLALGALIWLHYSGRLRLTSALLPLLAAGGLAFVALRLAVGGNLLPSLVVGGVGAFIFWQQRRASAHAKPVTPSAAAPASGNTAQLAEARAILGVMPDADAAAIRAAHRQLVERVHPDKGGSAELTRQVNAARDLLLRDIDDKSR